MVLSFPPSLCSPPSTNTSVLTPLILQTNVSNGIINIFRVSFNTSMLSSTFSPLSGWIACLYLGGCLDYSRSWPHQFFWSLTTTAGSVWIGTRETQPRQFFGSPVQFLRPDVGETPAAKSCANSLWRANFGGAGSGVIQIAPRCFCIPGASLHTLW